MNLFTILSRKAPNRIFISIFFGALSGMVYSFMIPLITAALKQPDGRFQTVEAVNTTFLMLKIADAHVALLFALGCIFILVCKTLSQISLADTAMDVASDLRVDLYCKIANAPLSSLEQIGIPKLLSAMTQDIPAFIAGAQLLPDLLVHAVTMLGMLGFLFYLNAAVFWFVLGAICFGIVTYQIPMLLGRKYFIKNRSLGDSLDSAIHGLVRGMKELKLSDEKRRAFFDTMLMNYEAQLLGSTKTGNNIVRVASNYGEMVCFFIMGVLTFIFKNYHAVDNSELLAGVMVLLYVTNPISAILHFIPAVINSKIAIARFSTVVSRLSDEQIDRPAFALAPWDTVRFEKVCYQHPQNGEDRGFKIGPIDLDFRKGQVTFIVGGNGSGKSTLCKLLTLHYLPTYGEIRFGDTLIARDSIAACRQSIGAIYSDYHLFDRLLGVTCAPETVQHYLRMLKLEGKVRYENGKFSTLALSDGQRRRLALLVAFVEDKELYLFDEWAADQDPVFKEIFYHEILPSLKARGKAVVAITHDDRYFHVADKIILMEDGLVAAVNFNDKPSNGSVVKMDASVLKAYK